MALRPKPGEPIDKPKDSEKNLARKLLRDIAELRRKVNLLGTDYRKIGWAGDPKIGPIVVYDDPTCKAASFKIISLLLRKPEGREAFPGEVFYCHSRLLERGAGVAVGVTLKVDPSVTPDGNVKLNIVPESTAKKIKGTSLKASLPPNHVFIGGKNPFISQAMRRILLSSIENTGVTTTTLPDPKDNKAKKNDAKKKDGKQTSLNKGPNDPNASPKKPIKISGPVSGEVSGIPHLEVVQFWAESNAPTADTKPGVTGGSLDISYRRTFGPDIGIGRNAAGNGPLHNFDNNFGGFNLGYRFWVVPNFDLWGNRLRFDARVKGGIFGSRDRKADSNTPGFIVSIGGNLTPITASRNIQMDLDGHHIGGRITGTMDQWIAGKRLLVSVLIGALFVYTHYNYEYRSQVSGGAGFFSYNLGLQMKTLVAGVVAGIYLTYKVTSLFSITVGGEVEPVYQTYRLNATQTGNAQPPAASVQLTDNGFALRARFGLKLNYDLTKRLRLSGFVFGNYDSAMPDVIYPTVGGARLGIARHQGMGISVGIRASYRY